MDLFFCQESLLCNWCTLLPFFTDSIWLTRWISDFSFSSKELSLLLFFFLFGLIYLKFLSLLIAVSNYFGKKEWVYQIYESYPTIRPYFSHNNFELFLGLFHSDILLSARFPHHCLFYDLRLAILSHKEVALILIWLVVQLCQDIFWNSLFKTRNN